MSTGVNSLAVASGMGGRLSLTTSVCDNARLSLITLPSLPHPYAIPMPSLSCRLVCVPALGCAPGPFGMSSLLALPPLPLLSRGVVVAGEVEGGGLATVRSGEVAFARIEGLTLPLVEGLTRWTTWCDAQTMH